MTISLIQTGMEPGCLKALFVPLCAVVMSEPKVAAPPFWEKHQQTLFLEKTTLLCYHFPEQSGQATSLTKQ